MENLARPERRGRVIRRGLGGGGGTIHIKTVRESDNICIKEISHTKDTAEKERKEAMSGRKKKGGGGGGTIHINTVRESDNI